MVGYWNLDRCVAQQLSATFFRNPLNFFFQLRKPFQIIVMHFFSLLYWCFLNGHVIFPAVGDRVGNHKESNHCLKRDRGRTHWMKIHIFFPGILFKFYPNLCAHIVLEFTSHKVRKEKIQILMHICVIFHLFHLLFLISGNPRVLNFCLKWKLSIHFCSVCELDPWEIENKMRIKDPCTRLYPM